MTMEIIRAWERATGRAVVVSPANRAIVDAAEHTGIDLDNIIEWRLRECDRADWRDWVPYRVCMRTARPNISVTVYYVGATHQLTLTMNAMAQITITEWDGSRIISSVPACVESQPGCERPSEEEVQRVLAGLNVYSADPPP